ncbi:MAG: hypothetical protein IPN85_16600 [Flavobacteriales bacterium]|nr:hypothetical protein [Flavobacteriales bacterium]MBL0035053.1 hypothetical protein [Flavobacteriales bacterium]
MTGHALRVHGRKRYYIELRQALQRAIGVGEHAEVTGALSISTGVT